MLVLSYAFGLLPIDPERVVALRSVRNVVFKRPVAIGITIHADAEITGMRPLDADHGLVELALRVRGADGRIVARGTIEVLWRDDEDSHRGKRRRVRARAGSVCPWESPRLMLSGKRLLVTGVITRHSIAFAVAREAQLAGAEVILTGFGRTRRMTERAAKRLPEPPDVLELDVNSEADLASVAMSLTDDWGSLDGVLHAIAYAPEDAIGGGFLKTGYDSAALAFRTSAYSLQALARHLAPLLEDADGGGSIVGLDFDASVAWPAYDWMGVAKAALESTSRYLAGDLGPRRYAWISSPRPGRDGGRGGIPGFGDLAERWQQQAPLARTCDPTPVARAVASSSRTGRRP